jgi:hypothetical protein
LAEGRRRGESDPDRALQALLWRELVREEDPGTAALIERLRHIKQKREFTRAEFLLMCRWKSPRAALHYAENRPAVVRAISREALAARSERRRLELLMTLRGVSVPVASAILTLIDPRRYGVLDIRAWQLLFRLGCVESKPGGRGFRPSDWLRYLGILRDHGGRLRATPRAIEYTLFLSHRVRQSGRLYDKVKTPASSPSGGRASARGGPGRRSSGRSGRGAFPVKGRSRHRVPDPERKSDAGGVPGTRR